MKKNILHAAILALSAPMCVYSLGLGQMTVKSALDQPFLAEIELVDVKSTAIKDIKINVADSENFEEIGIERAAVLSLLTFQIAKNDQGKEVIKVQSTERMTEPYIELVVDLTWPDGQLYKAYTILLDPPGYHLVSSTIQGGQTHYKQYLQHHKNEPGVINKTIVTTVTHNPVPAKDNRKKATYGPTVTNESVWQIAQRYKSSELILPQVVLAIVGANPEAFKEGNLNGLQVGVRLTIPAASDMLKVPADLATAEVMAHDKAWNDKAVIEHVITPPYTQEQSNDTIKPTVSGSSSTDFNITPVPIPSTTPQLLPNDVVNPLTTNQPTAQPSKLQSIEQNTASKAELSVAVAAVDSIREANAFLMEQLQSIQKQNNALQKQLDQRNKEIESLRSQIQVLVQQRGALPAQATSVNSSDSFGIWPYILLALAAGGGFAYWYVRNRQAKEALEPETAEETTPFVTPRMDENKAEVKSDIINNSELMVIEQEPAVIKDEEPIASPYESAPIVSEEPPIEPIESVDAQNERSEEEIQIEELSTGEEPVIILEQEPVVEEKESAPTHEPVEESGPLEFTFETPEENAERIKPLEVTKESEPTSEEPVSESPAEEYLEFESGLHTTLTSSEEEAPIKTEAEDNQSSIDFVAPTEEDFFIEMPIEKPKPQVDKPQEDNVIEIDESLSQFFAENEEQNKEEEPSEEEASQDLGTLKSKKALDTLIDLSKTYISMDDFESARSSLEEVLEHGTEEQKTEANSLLESIKGK